MRRTWLIFSQAVTVAVAVLFVIATLKPQWLPGEASPAAPAVVTLPPPVAPVAGASGAIAAPGSYSAAARRATPAVVSITARKAPARTERSNDPWFQFFFGDAANRPQQPQVGLGSGVIVSPDGYLLTNHHVIQGADDIEVQLADGRQATARLQVGDVVLAIGNPFGVGQTVTSGIVSALGRDQLGINTFENFIQTDAAINPGNSGGALVDAYGNLVGINTAIYSRSGGNMGIGFAIPVSTAKQVMEGLIKDGQVTRGWIGVEPRDLTPEIAQTLNLPIRQGVLITGVLQSGPAAAGGVRPGDVVVRVDSKVVATTPQLLNAVAALRPNEKAVIGVQRGDKALDLSVTVAQRPKVARSRPAQ
jgi:serine protease DegQ